MGKGVEEEGALHIVSFLEVCKGQWRDQHTAVLPTFLPSRSCSPPFILEASSSSTPTPGSPQLILGLSVPLWDPGLYIYSHYQDVNVNERKLYQIVYLLSLQTNI